MIYREIIGMMLVYISLPWILKRFEIHKKIMFLLPLNLRNRCDFRIQDIYNVVVISIFSIIGASFFVFSKQRSGFLNDNYVDYFFGSITLMMGLLNIFALLILINNYFTKNKREMSKFNFLLHYLCLFFEILVWLLYMDYFIVQKKLGIIFIVSILYTFCRFMSNSILKRDFIILGVMLSFITMFFLLLHLFFIENLISTIILAFLFFLYNYVSITLYYKQLSAIKKNNNDQK